MILNPDVSQVIQKPQKKREIVNITRPIQDHTQKSFLQSTQQKQQQQQNDQLQELQKQAFENQKNIEGSDINEIIQILSNPSNFKIKYIRNKKQQYLNDVQIYPNFVTQNQQEQINVNNIYHQQQCEIINEEDIPMRLQQFGDQGLTFLMQNQYKDAIQQFRNAEIIFDQYLLNDGQVKQELIFFIILNLGISFYKVGLFEEAHSCFENCNKRLMTTINENYTDYEFINSNYSSFTQCLQSSFFELLPVRMKNNRLRISLNLQNCILFSEIGKHNDAYFYAYNAAKYSFNLIYDSLIACLYELNKHELFISDQQTEANKISQQTRPQTCKKRNKSEACSPKNQKFFNQNSFLNKFVQLQEDNDLQFENINVGGDFKPNNSTKNNQLMFQQMHFQSFLKNPNELRKIQNNPILIINSKINKDNSFDQNIQQQNQVPVLNKTTQNINKNDNQKNEENSHLLPQKQIHQSQKQIDNLQDLYSYCYQLIPILNEIMEVLDEVKLDFQAEQREKIIITMKKMFQQITKMDCGFQQQANINILTKDVDQNHWIYKLNILNLLQLRPMNFCDILKENDLKCELMPNQIMKKIVCLGICFYCMSTEIRFLEEQTKLRNSLDKTQNLNISKAEFWLGKSLEVCYAFLPIDCPILTQIISVYNRFHSIEKQVIPEEGEICDKVKMLRPLKGSSYGIQKQNFFIPLIRKQSKQSPQKEKIIFNTDSAYQTKTQPTRPRSKENKNNQYISMHQSTHPDSSPQKIEFLNYIQCDVQNNQQKQILAIKKLGNYARLNQIYNSNHLKTFHNKNSDKKGQKKQKQIDLSQTIQQINNQNINIYGNSYNFSNTFVAPNKQTEVQVDKIAFPQKFWASFEQQQQTEKIKSRSLSKEKVNNAQNNGNNFNVILNPNVKVNNFVDGETAQQQQQQMNSKVGQKLNYSFQSSQIDNSIDNSNNKCKIQSDQHQKPQNVDIQINNNINLFINQDPITQNIVNFNSNDNKLSSNNQSPNKYILPQRSKSLSKKNSIPSDFTEKLIQQLKNQSNKASDQKRKFSSPKVFNYLNRKLLFMDRRNKASKTENEINEQNNDEQVIIIDKAQGVRQSYECKTKY